MNERLGIGESLLESLCYSKRLDERLGERLSERLGVRGWVKNWVRCWVSCWMINLIRGLVSTKVMIHFQLMSPDKMVFFIQNMLF